MLGQTVQDAQSGVADRVEVLRANARQRDKANVPERATLSGRPAAVVDRHLVAALCQSRRQLLVDSLEPPSRAGIPRVPMHAIGKISVLPGSPTTASEAVALCMGEPGQRGPSVLVVRLPQRQAGWSTSGRRRDLDLATGMPSRILRR